MFKNSNCTIFYKDNIKNHQISYGLNQIGYSGDVSARSGYQISELQKKIQMFGGMQQVQEDIITELNRNSHRLDNLINKVRAFMKLQPTNNSNQKRSAYMSYSPSPIQSHQSHIKSQKVQNSSRNKMQTTVNMRLKDRVQKALKGQQQNIVTNTKSKYIK